MRKSSIIILTLIVLLGTFFRFYKLHDFPVGFHRDEAFLGYNAYSILRTGRDISSSFLPLHLQSFIYSPAGYSYLSIPFIKFFGLNAFSVRFAAALFGSITIIVVFCLTRELFLGQRLTQIRKRINTDILALLASLLLAISPWHINLSRTVTENTVVVFFITLGTFLYLLWTRRNNWFLLPLSFVFFGATLFIYQAPRVFLPLFIPLLALCFLFGKINKVKLTWIGILFFTIIILPLVFILSSKNLSLRIRTVSVFANSQTQLILDREIREDGVEKTQNLTTRVFHNKLVGYSQEVLSNYFKHFSYDFLFTDKGFPDRYRVPLTGLVYLFELPLLFLGAWVLLKKEKRVGIFLLTFVALVPVGSALTFDDVPNLQRTLLFIPILSIISSVGLLYLISQLKNGRIIKRLTIFIFFAAAVFSFSFYLHQYYLHSPWYNPWVRQDGYKELVAKVNALLPYYKKAVITDRESAPSIFFLFFGNYDPALFQKEKQKSMPDYDRINFGKYEFSQEECPARVEKEKIIGEKAILYVNSGLCKAIVGHIEEIAVIKRKDTSVAFRIVTIK